MKARRGLDDDQLAEVLGRSVDWVRHTLAFGARHPEGEDRLTIRPASRSPPGSWSAPDRRGGVPEGVEPPRFARDQLTWLAYLSLSAYAFYIYALGPVVAFLHQELYLSYTLTSLHPPSGRSARWSPG